MVLFQGDGTPCWHPKPFSVVVATKIRDCNPVAAMLSRFFTQKKYKKLIKQETTKSRVRVSFSYFVVD